MEKMVNWIIVALGGILIIAEVILGAATGFDLALMGACLVLGGAMGLGFASTQVGLFSSAALAFLYLAVLRRRIRSRLMGRDRPSNVDALIGRKALVTARIADHACGTIKLGDEVWRASLAPGVAPAALEPGQEVIVESVDGVTLIVR